MTDTRYGPALPIEEISRILKKHMGASAGRRRKDDPRISFAEIVKHGLGYPRKSLIYALAKGIIMPEVGPLVLARLSRFLVMLELGLVRRENGKIVFLPMDKAAPPCDIVFKLDLAFGRPKLKLQPQATLQDARQFFRSPIERAQ